MKDTYTMATTIIVLDEQATLDGDTWHCDDQDIQAILQLVTDIEQIPTDAPSTEAALAAHVAALLGGWLMKSDLSDR